MNVLARKIIFLTSISSVIFGGLVSCGKKDQKQSGQPQAVAPVVKVAEAKEKDIPIYQEWIGTVTGTINATILPKVQGYIVKQDYMNGQFVKKGDLLFTLDDRPYVAELQNAEAKLEQARTNYQKNKADVERYTPLVETNAVSRKTLDDAHRAMESAAAEIKQAQAQVETAKLNLEYTRITSPINGIAGIADAQVGDLVSANSKPLTTISQLDPVKVDFPVAEQDVLEFYRKNPRFSPDRLVKDSGKSPDLELFLSNGSLYPSKGKIIYLDRQVDKKTGTINVVAAFPNEKNMLRPGMFTRIRAVADTMKNAIVIPGRAIRDYQGIHTVDLVVKNEQGQFITKSVPVKVGQSVGHDRVILKGLKTGDSVVVEGLMKRSGSVVDPKPYEPAPEKK